MCSYGPLKANRIVTSIGVSSWATDPGSLFLFNFIIRVCF